MTAKKRIEELERKVRELEARPVMPTIIVQPYVPTAPAPVYVPTPYFPDWHNPGIGFPWITYSTVDVKLS